MSSTNGKLDLATARRLTPPVQSSLAAGLGAAVLAEIGPDDVAEIIRLQVQKAKAGNSAAAKFVLDLVGKAGKSAPAPMDGRPSPDPTVGELRRRIARYLIKNGATPEPELCELFEIEPDEAETVLVCEWFDKATAGWHINKQGRKENT